MAQQPKQVLMMKESYSRVSIAASSTLRDHALIDPSKCRSLFVTMIFLQSYILTERFSLNESMAKA
jgi:hypothetical protein